MDEIQIKKNILKKLSVMDGSIDCSLFGALLDYEVDFLSELYNIDKTNGRDIICKQLSYILKNIKTDFKEVPVEILEQMMQSMELDAMIKFSKTNARAYRLFNNERFTNNLLKKYGVNSEDNFLYFLAGFDSPKKSLYDLSNLQKMEEIDTKNSGDFDEFPILPKLKSLNLSGENSLITLPLLENLEFLKLGINIPEFTLPDGMSKLKVLDCGDNSYIRSLPRGMENLKELNCSRVGHYINMEFDKGKIGIRNHKLKNGDNIFITDSGLDILGDKVIEVIDDDTIKINVDAREYSFINFFIKSKLPDDMINLERLECSTSSFNTLPKNMKKLLYLECIGNFLKKLPTDMKSLETLICSNNNLVNLPGGMVNLTSLICEHNQLTSLPEGMVNLKTLFCNDNQLTSLPDGMVNLKTLICKNNQLTSLPDGMVSLEILDCSHNRLVSLPEMVNLKKLECNDNQLTGGLPEGMTFLQDLNCENNQLTSLPQGMKNLSKLNCADNQLTSLPADIENLKVLDCPYNNLTNLPNGMKKLKLLSCVHNDIDVLPIDTNLLQDLFCDSNKNLSEIPNEIGKNLKRLYCRGTSLSSLPNGMEKLVILDCRYNEYLKILPKDMKSLVSLNADEDRISNLELYAGAIEQKEPEIDEEDQYFFN